MEWLTEEWLQVGQGHELCLRSAGNPAGVPAVFLHGGPGSGVQTAHLALFDPARFHIIAFDQRGAGLSRPKRSTADNTTAHLVADLEVIRDHFGISEWLVVGGSWGATLALAYGVAHPDRVLGMVLRAVFLGTRAELNRAFLTHLPTFYPALFDDFLNLLPAADRADPLEAYWQRILDPDPAVYVPFARAWHDTERILSSLAPDSARLNLDRVTATTGPLPNSPFMEAHYFAHDCFLDEPLLAGVSRLSSKPGVVIQGRYDLLCPPTNAHALAAAWPEVSVQEISAAGHSLGDRVVFEAMQKAISEMADYLGY